MSKTTHTKGTHMKASHRIVIKPCTRKIKGKAVRRFNSYIYSVDNGELLWFSQQDHSRRIDCIEPVERFIAAAKAGRVEIVK